MRALRFAVAMLIVFGLAGCGAAAKGVTMPDVTGKKLDVAYDIIKGVGFDDKDKIKVDGGGAFGVVIESNWTVCYQSPAAGEAMTDAPRLTIDRSCKDNSPTKETNKPTQTPTPTTAPPTPKQTPKPPNSQGAKAMEKAYVAHLGGKRITSLCDDAYTNWACFYDGVKDGSGYLQVNLTTDGGWSGADLNEMADQAGRAWFNFIGCDFRTLKTIVVTINGIDHNVFRHNTKADSLC